MIEGQRICGCFIGDANTAIARSRQHRTGQWERSAVSQTSASASPENNRQPEQDDCDRHKRRAGDVSEQDEDDRDDGEDCCDVVVHSFSIVGLLTLRCEPTPCRLCGGAQVA
jgi:hypothetical protein